MTPAWIQGAVWVALLCAACAKPVGDAARGEQLHEQCLGCHGTELYRPPHARLKTRSELQKEVERWNDSMNPVFDEQEVADIVAYLNASFYKFE